MRLHTPMWYRMAVGLVLVAALLTSVACAKREEDAGSFAALTPNLPVLKEYRGAQVYLLRQGDEDVVALWGMSPLGGGEQGKVRCFIQDRTDRPFRGETRPFIDPCNGAWWTRDGTFLGYTKDPESAPSSGPPLVRIPAEVHDGRVILDDAYLQCLQSRRDVCEQ